MYLPALQEVLVEHKRRQSQQLYAAHLVWVLGAQLFALGGGQDYPIPDVYALFPDASGVRDHRTANDIRRLILDKLRRPSTHSEQKGD